MISFFSTIFAALFEMCCLILVTLFLAGCSSRVPIGVVYPELENVSWSYSSKNRIRLYLELPPYYGDHTWYETNHRVWILERTPREVVFGLLKGGLSILEIELCKDAALADARLNVDIRWFGPYGCSPNSAAIMLSMTLFDQNGEEVLWRGKAQGGVSPGMGEGNMFFVSEDIEKNLTAAIAKTIDSLVWNSSFHKAIMNLSRVKRMTLH